MDDVEQLSVWLPPALVTELRLVAERGEFGSVSDIVRDALVEWRRQHDVAALPDDELRRLVQEGIDSGSGLDAGEAFGRLRARYSGPAPV